MSTRTRTKIVRRSKRQPNKSKVTAKTVITRLRRTKRARVHNPPRNALTALGSSSRPLNSRSARNTMSMTNGKFGDRIRIKGTELIGTVVVPDGGDVANCLLYHRFNNADPPNTRAGEVAHLYEQWIPHVYDYDFIPSVPTGTQAGTYVFGQIADPTRELISGASGLASSIRVVPGSAMKQYWQPAVAQLPTNRKYTALWTVDPNAGTVTSADRLDLAGQVALVTVTPGSIAAGTAIGAIELRYDIEYFIPRLSLSSTAKKTTIRAERTSAIAAGIIPPISSGTVTSAINGFVAALATEVKKSAPEAIQNGVKNFVSSNLLPFSSDMNKDEYHAALRLQRLALGNIRSPSSFGFPPGNYTFTLSMFTDTPPIYTDDSKGGLQLPLGSPIPNITYLKPLPAVYTDGIFALGVEYYNADICGKSGSNPNASIRPLVELYSLTAIDDPVTTMSAKFTEAIDPLGVGWLWGESYTIEFASTSNTDRCFADVPLAWSGVGANDCPTDAVFFVSLSVASDTVVYPTGSFPTEMKRAPLHRPKLVEGKESKEERKDQLVIPRARPPVVETKVNGSTVVKLDLTDDGWPEEVSPPRFGTPVDIPGSTDYTPRSTPSTQKLAEKRGPLPFRKPSTGK